MIVFLLLIIFEACMVILTAAGLRIDSLCYMFIILLIFFFIITQ